MTRHIIDKPKTVNLSRRAAVFLHMERQMGRSEFQKLAHKRGTLKGSGRMREFLRIDRGYRA